jgi:ribosomal protein S18 acetylase RimI-like enzyme
MDFEPMAGPDEIRLATVADLDVLNDFDQDHNGYFADRLCRQRQGRGELIVAWLDGRPVGDVYVWREPADEAKIRRHLWGVPLLQRARVTRALRRNGIGTDLLTAAENLLQAYGYRHVALAVREDNVDAQRLYQRLRYRNWNRGTVSCRARDGSAERETCLVMVKALPAVANADGIRLATASWLGRCG